MQIEPTDREIASRIGISETNVTFYKIGATLLDESNWIIHFAFHMPKVLRRSLAGSFSVIIARQTAPGIFSNDTGS